MKSIPLITDNDNNESITITKQQSNIAQNTIEMGLGERPLLSSFVVRYGYVFWFI